MNHRCCAVFRTLFPVLVSLVVSPAVHAAKVDPRLSEIACNQVYNEKLRNQLSDAVAPGLMRLQQIEVNDFFRRQNSFRLTLWNLLGALHGDRSGKFGHVLIQWGDAYTIETESAYWSIAVKTKVPPALRSQYRDLNFADVVDPQIVSIVQHEKADETLSHNFEVRLSDLTQKASGPIIGVQQDLNEIELFAKLPELLRAVGQPALTSEKAMIDKLNAINQQVEFRFKKQWLSGQKPQKLRIAATQLSHLPMQSLSLKAYQEGDEAQVRFVTSVRLNGRTYSSPEGMLLFTRENSTILYEIARNRNDQIRVFSGAFSWQSGVLEQSQGNFGSVERSLIQEFIYDTEVFLEAMK